MKSTLPLLYPTVPLTGRQDTPGKVRAFEGYLNFNKQIDVTVRRVQTKARPKALSVNPGRSLTMTRMQKSTVHNILDMENFDRDKVTAVQNKRRGDYTDQELKDWAYTIVGPEFEWENRASAARKILGLT